MVVPGANTCAHLQDGTLAKGDPALAELIRVEGLSTSFATEDGLVQAVNHIDFTVQRGETLGIVGESGCGKSVTSLSVMRLIAPPGRIDAGHIFFEGEDLLKKSEAEMRRLRGNEISMIFQEPMTSLNPVYTIGDQISEAIVLHLHKSRREATNLAIEMLRKVGIPVPEKRVHEYPHQLSGGMRQRVMIAMALSCNPKLLIADEPTTALDVTIQAQILELMKGLKDEFGMSIMIITHDLGVIAEMADRVVVMYAGQIVESGTVQQIFERPAHPYTEGLLRSIPRLDQPKGKLHVIEGVVPNPLHMPTGCAFSPRCPYVQERCRTGQPELVSVAGGQMMRCVVPLAEREGAIS